MKTQTENNQENTQGTPETGYTQQQQSTNQQPDRDRVGNGTQPDYRERTTRNSSVTTSAGGEEISNRNEEDQTAEEEMDETLEGDDEWDEEDTMGDADEAEADAEDRA